MAICSRSEKVEKVNRLENGPRPSQKMQLDRGTSGNGLRAETKTRTSVLINGRGPSRTNFINGGGLLTGDGGL